MSETITTQADLAKVLGSADRGSDGTLQFLNNYTVASGNVISKADLGAMLASAKRDSDGVMTFAWPNS